MVPPRNLHKKEDNKKKQLGNPSLATDTSEVGDAVSSHVGGCNNPQINSFLNVMPSGISPHIGEICLLDFSREKKDLPLEIHQTLIAEILGEGRDVSLKKDSMGPLLQSSEY